jgi:prevent-host-death family protein
MLAVGCREAKTHFAALLERVSRGARIAITQRGVPVAMLVPMEPAKKRERSDVIRELKEFGKRRTLEGLAVRELIEEGRRF